MSFDPVAAQLLVPRQESKTAAMFCEYAGEQNREGRPATELAEASKSCRRFLAGAVER